MKNYTKLTEKQVKAVETLISKGMTDKEIMDIVDISKSSLYRIKHGEQVLQRKKKQVNPISTCKEDLQAHYKEAVKTNDDLIDVSVKQLLLSQNANLIAIRNLLQDLLKIKKGM